MVAPSFLVFFVVYAMSFYFSWGFDDWFVVWMGLEMNMLSFISLSFFRKVFGREESLYKYFFVQSLASGIFLVMMYVGGMVSLVLSLKIGVGPFYFWLPSVMVGLDWMMNFVLMSFQKILPLVLICGVGGEEMWTIGIASLLIGVLGSFNQSNLRKFMAFSSVSNLGWVVLGQSIGGMMWMMYYFVYVMVLFFVVRVFSKLNMEVLGGMFMSNFVLVMLVFSLAGVPPTVGFVMKWVLLSFVLELDFFSGLVMIVSSLIMFYIYVRVVYGVMVGGGMIGPYYSKEKVMSVWEVILFLGVFMFPLFFWLTCYGK